MIEKFVKDPPHPPARSAVRNVSPVIDGVVLEDLAINPSERGTLIELLTTRDGPIEPIVHVYQVIAEAGSLRGWVYHAKRCDRLVFTLGDFEVRLLDLRPGSPTRGTHLVLRLGSARPCRLTLPAMVAHAVRNAGNAAAAFVNLPTRPYDPADPDSFRYEGPVEDLVERDA